MRSSLLGGAFVVVAVAGMWSCGGSSPGASPTSPSVSASPSSTTINITGQSAARSFSPSPATVAQDGLVSFHNADNTTHHIVMNDGSLDTGDIAPGASSAALRLATDGANYHCTIHPTMTGSINARAGEPPPCVGAYCP